jgi:hypothetical protein
MTARFAFLVGLFLGVLVMAASITWQAMRRSEADYGKRVVGWRDLEGVDSV